MEQEFDHTATYSPDDNKLRMYPGYRLDKEDYNRFRSAGFKWAPRQELFVAPMWKPSREDLLIEFCGSIGDEDTSLTERAEERSDRFEEYSEKRLEDANRAKDGVSAITEHIPLGQPILVGHHSEKRARKDAQKIENGMRYAVKMWETSKYWTDRAAGALRHAKYKESAPVRARRIKRIEADKRKQERSKAESERWIELWSAEGLTLEKAILIAGGDWDSSCYTLAEYPRDDHQYEGAIGVRGAMEYGIITQDQAKDRRIKAHTNGIAWCSRWIAHFKNRLAYEKAMLGEQGAMSLLEKPKRPKAPPLLNYRAPDGLSVENMYHRGEFSIYPQIEMTKAEFKAIYSEQRGTRIIEGSHRVRIKVSHREGWFVVFLTDSKVHEKPEPVEKESKPVPPPVFSSRDSYYQPPEKTEFDDLKESLKDGVKIISAPQLFPTPKELCEKVAGIVDIQPGHSILEPSAGTGSLIGAIGAAWYPDGKLVAVELNYDLCEHLKSEFPLTDVRQGDFLECNGDIGTFDRIMMNPPFKNGDDIKHIKHALTFLNTGGKLVAICADGPRQNDQLRPLADHWEKLPEGTFKNQGTMVNTVLIVINV